MTEHAREITPAWRARRGYLIAMTLIGWFFVDVFDGLVFPEEAVEHWVEAAWWAVAALGYLVLARRRPLPAAQRLADAGIGLGLVMMGVTLALRATLPDNLAFRWSLVVMAAYGLVVWVMVRGIRARAKVPENG